MRPNVNVGLRTERFLIIPAAMLVGAALLPLPYGYYTLLRLVVTLAAGWVAYITYSEKQEVGVTVIIGMGVALLFNPIFPVHLSRSIWFPIDLVVAGWFGFLAFRHKKT